MKVMLDPQIFHWQEYGGISRYVFELLRYLDGRDDVDVTLPLYHSCNAYIAGAPCAPHRRWLGSLPRQASHPGWWSSLRRRVHASLLKRLDWRNRRMARQAVAAGDWDVCHVTYFDTYLLEQLAGRPFVITVYDMIHELFPEHFGSTDIPERKRALVNAATRVIAISDHTKQDLVRIYGLDPDRIDVVHLASSLTPGQGTRPGKPVDLPPRYILHVGDRALYKNFDRLLRAAAPLLRQDADLHLVCAGGRRFSEQEQAAMAGLGVGAQVRHIRIDDGVLAQAYGGALCFVFPSLYEGFGIPLLEAFSCGCPVAASNVSSLPEVAGDAAEYFDPRSEQAMRDALSRLVADPARRQELVDLGRARLAQFSWQRVGEQTLDVYRRALQGA